MKPMQFAIYKGTGGKYGALQLNLQLPHFYQGNIKDFEGLIDSKGENSRAAFTVKDGKVALKDGWATRDGCIFVEATSAKDKNVYDWENKVVMALSPGDMGKVLYFLTTGKTPDFKKWNSDGEKTLTIMHDPGAKSTSAGSVMKYLTLSSPDGTAKGAMVTVKQVSGETEKKHTIPLSGDEVISLRSLLQAAIVRSLNW